MNAFVMRLPLVLLILSVVRLVKVLLFMGRLVRVTVR